MPIDQEDGEIDVRLLVRWLGPDGAMAGLEKSKRHTTERLVKLGEQLGLAVPKSATRQEMLRAIVREANKRIDKPIADLVRMMREDLISYLERADPSREELLNLLKEIDATPSKEGRQGLIEFAARELSETGRFMRIATSGTPGGTETDPPERGTARR